jgi:hypothetical protein
MDTPFIPESFEPDYSPYYKTDFIKLDYCEPNELFPDFHLLAKIMIDEPKAFGIRGKILRLEKSQYANTVNAIYLPDDCVEQECDCSWSKATKNLPKSEWETIDEDHHDPEDCEEQEESFDYEWVKVFNRQSYYR